MVVRRPNTKYKHVLLPFTTLKLVNKTLHLENHVPAYYDGQIFSWSSF